MKLTAKQLKQIAELCEILSTNEDKYSDGDTDATLINTKIMVTTRKGKLLGNVAFNHSSYVFESL